MNVDLDIIAELQSKTDQIRNICVLAHVDHGKTTLSDHLIASNGLIHPRLAGEVRYMDSKDEEQARGITMKSSSISLLFVPGAALRPQGPNSVSREEKVEQGYLINLIDSPGHVDFCSEVSTAARLSDGAFVVVDAVEGVCIQTHAVLRQAFEEKVRLCLVINKMDRLILELRLTPQEAYERVKSIIAHVNMIISSFHSEKYISEADSVLAYEDAKAAAGDAAQRRAEGEGHANGAEEHAGEGQEGEEDEQEFSPEKGNVAFASAHDGWAFRTTQFAEMYAAKMGCKASALNRALWGDYAYQPKTKRIVRIKSDQYGRAKPLFVQLALEPLWKMYGACEPGEDHKALLTKMAAGLGLSGRVSEHTLAHPDARSALRAVLRAWLPLAEATLQMAAEHLPSPKAAAPERLPRLLPPRGAGLQGREAAPELEAALEAAEGALRACSTDPQAPCVVYVSKMVAVPANALPRVPGEPGPSNPTEERFLAFGRVFSGVLRAGQAVHVLPPTYNPADPDSTQQAATLGALYLMMGRGLERLQEVPAGNVLAIAGLDMAILKSATVASTPLCRPLAPMLFQSAPIVRVAVEPAHPGDMPALVEGLRLLHRADPLVQVSVQDTGEHVIAAAGEIHLETCVKDLRERFARVELLVSPPLVAFRETVACPAELPPEVVPKPARVVEATTPNGACTLRVRAVPLPAALAMALDQHADLLARLAGGGQAAARQESDAGQTGLARPPSQLSMQAAAGEGEEAQGGSEQSLAAFGARLASLAKGEGANPQLAGLLKRAWVFGPRRVGPNLLLAAPPSAAAAAAAGVAHEGSLFDVPSALVSKLSKQAQHGRGPMPAATSRPGEVAEGEHAAEEEHQQQEGERHASLALGFAEAAQKLGLVGSHDTSASHAQEAAAELASQMADLDMSTTEHAQHGQHAHQHQPQDGEGGEAQAGEAAAQEAYSRNIEYLRYSVESGVVAGFQMATAAGPLCDEPMWGVAFEVEARLNVGQQQQQGGAASVRLAEDVYGPFSGQVTSAARQALRRAVLEADPRLAEALFLCEVSTSSEALSGVYAVLGRRRSRILREEMREGSDLFIVHAYLPAEASFGFADELRRRSSGAAAASLLLSHWERLQVDPFFVPVTEEDREEFGEEGQGVGAPNLAKRLIDAVRRRKGLPVEEKVVESATKQRTRARKV